jgi:GT2 family glycosyltransferase
VAELYNISIVISSYNLACITEICLRFLNNFVHSNFSCGFIYIVNDNASLDRFKNFLFERRGGGRQKHSFYARQITDVFNVKQIHGNVANEMQSATKDAVLSMTTTTCLFY